MRVYNPTSLGMLVVMKVCLLQGRHAQDALIKSERFLSYSLFARQRVGYVPAVLVVVEVSLSLFLLLYYSQAWS